ncbi:hypothetical protein Tco_0040495 [Tanacetum coccineum]
MIKIDVEPITPKLLNKKTAHFAYIKHTQEEATVLKDLVKHVKTKYPLDHSLESAYFDELTTMASENSSLGLALHEMTPATISSGLVPNPPPLTLIDHSAPEVIAPINEVIAPVLADSTGSPSSTTVDQDAPSSSNSQTTPATEPPLILNDVEEDNHDIEVAHMGNDPYFGVLILEIPSD